MSSLDDLLSYPEEEPSPHRARRRSRYRWLIAPVLISAVGAVVGGGILRLMGLGAPYTLIFMVLLVVQLLRRTLAWIAPARVPASLLHPVESAGRVGETAADGLYLATARWDTRLSWVRLQHDPAQFARTVQPRIVQLLDERLRLRHGVRRETEPDRARELLGDALWTFATRPVARSMTPRELAALITQMEAL
jgi:hypothetical protein